MATVPESMVEIQCVLPPDYLDPFAGDDVALLEPPVEAFVLEEPTLPFAEWIRSRASLVRFDGRDSAAATWLAGKIDQLAADAEFLRAQSPDEFDAREQIMSDDAPLIEAQPQMGTTGFWYHPDRSDFHAVLVEDPYWDFCDDPTKAFRYQVRIRRNGKVATQGFDSLADARLSAQLGITK